MIAAALPAEEEHTGSEANPIEAAVSPGQENSPDSESEQIIDGESRDGTTLGGLRTAQLATLAEQADIRQAFSYSRCTKLLGDVNLGSESPDP